MNNSFVKGFQAMDTAYHRAAQNKRLQVEHDQNQEDRAALGTAMQGMYDAAAGYDHPGVGPRPAIDPNDPFGGNGDPSVDAWGARRQTLNQQANVHRMGMKAAMASRDMTAFTTSNTAYRQQQLSDIQAHVAAMPPDHLGAVASRLNSNNSELPFVYGGVNPQGQHILSIIQKGGTDDGKVQSTRTLSEHQLRQLAVANMMAERGFGTQAMDLLGTVDKAIADAAAAQMKHEMERTELNRKVYETTGQVKRWGDQSNNDAARTEVAGYVADTGRLNAGTAAYNANTTAARLGWDMTRGSLPSSKTFTLGEGRTAIGVADPYTGQITIQSVLGDNGEQLPVGPPPAWVTDPETAAGLKADGVTPATAVNDRGETIHVYHDVKGTAFYDPASAAASSKQIRDAEQAAKTEAKRKKEDAAAENAATAAEKAAAEKARIRAQQAASRAEVVARVKADKDAADKAAAGKAAADKAAAGKAARDAAAKKRAEDRAAQQRAMPGRTLLAPRPGDARPTLNRTAIQPPRQ